MAQQIATLDQLPGEVGSRSFCYTTATGAEQEAFLIWKQDEVRAYVNSCPHVGVALNWQPDKFLSFDEYAIICSTHGAMFTLLEGYCFQGPCKGQKLQSIAVEITDAGAITVVDGINTI